MKAARATTQRNHPTRNRLITTIRNITPMGRCLHLSSSYRPLGTQSSSLHAFALSSEAVFGSLVASSSSPLYLHNTTRNGSHNLRVLLLLLLIIIIKNEKIRVTLCENTAGALYIANKCVLMVREMCKGETN